jgi:hypothetical protein
MNDALRLAAESPVTRNVTFVSDETFRKTHLDGYAGIGYTPPYPNSLVVLPKRTAPATQVADLFGHGDHRVGIAYVFDWYGWR